MADTTPLIVELDSSAVMSMARSLTGENAHGAIEKRRADVCRSASRLIEQGAFHMIGGSMFITVTLLDL